MSITFEKITAGARPVTWAEALEVLHADETHFPEDEFNQLCDAAVDALQTELKQSLTETTRTIKHHITPREPLFELPYGPVNSIVSITDGNDAAITDYELRSIGYFDGVYINTAYKLPLTITYTAGNSVLSAMMKQVVLWTIAGFFENRQAYTDRDVKSVPHVERFLRRKSRSVGIG